MLVFEHNEANPPKERAINDQKEALYNLELANLKQEQTQGLLEEM